MRIRKGEEEQSVNTTVANTDLSYSWHFNIGHTNNFIVQECNKNDSNEVI